MSSLLVIIPSCNCPPKFPTTVSEYSVYKKSVERWSRERGCCPPRDQAQLILDSIPRDHPWRDIVMAASDPSIRNISMKRVMQILDACYEVCSLSKSMRKRCENIVSFIQKWEKTIEWSDQVGVRLAHDEGLDLLYACNLNKEDRRMILKDLSTNKMNTTTKNMANTIRRCAHHDSLSTIKMENNILAKKQEKKVRFKKRKRFVQRFFFGCIPV